MSKTRFTTRQLATAGIIAAVYTVMSMCASVFGIAYGPIQCRFSEALTVLPFFLPEAIPGLFIGCLVTNLMSTVGPLDIIFGSLATLAGALGTHYVGRKIPALGPVFPILANIIVVPPVLMYVYGVPDGYWFLVVTVGIGEVISCGVLGWLLYKVLKKRKIFSNE